MAIKKAIIRTEVLYNDQETNPDAIAKEMVMSAKKQKIYKLNKIKSKENAIVFETKDINNQYKIMPWSVLTIYYPYSPKPKDDE